VCSNPFFGCPGCCCENCARVPNNNKLLLDNLDNNPDNKKKDVFKFRGGFIPFFAVVLVLIVVKNRARAHFSNKLYSSRQ